MFSKVLYKSIYTYKKEFYSIVFEKNFLQPIKIFVIHLNNNNDKVHLILGSYNKSFFEDETCYPPVHESNIVLNAVESLYLLFNLILDGILYFQDNNLIQVS